MRVVRDVAAFRAVAYADLVTQRSLTGTVSPRGKGSRKRSARAGLNVAQRRRPACGRGKLHRPQRAWRRRPESERALGSCGAQAGREDQRGPGPGRSRRRTCRTIARFTVRRVTRRSGLRRRAGAVRRAVSEPGRSGRRTQGGRSRRRAATTARGNGGRRGTRRDDGARREAVRWSWGCRWRMARCYSLTHR